MQIEMSMASLNTVYAKLMSGPSYHTMHIEMSMTSLNTVYTELMSLNPLAVAILNTLLLFILLLIFFPKESFQGVLMLSSIS